MKIKLNPNKKIVKQIRQDVKDNDGFCPCKLIHSVDTKCMCKEFRDSNIEGYCHCGLYYKVRDEVE